MGNKVKVTCENNDCRFHNHDGETCNLKCIRIGRTGCRYFEKFEIGMLPIR